MALLAHSFSMHLSLANGTSTYFKPISFLKYTNNKTFTFNRMGLQHNMRIVFVNGFDIKLNDKWIGRRLRFEWPARSPDLSPMDFFLWGVLKDMVYKEEPRTIPDICRLIADKIATIDMELCQNVCRSVAARLVSCVKPNREQFELSE